MVAPVTAANARATSSAVAVLKNSSAFQSAQDTCAAVRDGHRA